MSPELSESLGLGTLQAALAKVERRRLMPANEREAFTQAEIDALSIWMAFQIADRGKESRAARSERNKAQWQAGDRRHWGGERRRRDNRRGWRNHSR